ncbi:calcium/proton exchanger [Clostridium sediminicola]|uniref:calcium/proton exchanger n=1 Tax=Clostridium sediminicola TaxID=3114879 RepID=UPI0031F20EED
MKKIVLYILSIIIIVFFHSEEFLLNSIIFSLLVIPLAAVLGKGTSNISEYIGDKKSGLIAATTGNMPELMMGLWSVNYGMIALVKSALIGSIICNMLLVLGISIFWAGIKYKEQNFNKLIARTNFSMLFLAISAIIVLTSLNSYSNLDNLILSSLSLKVSLVLIIIYILGLIFSLFTHRNLFLVSEIDEDIIRKKISSKDMKKKKILIINIIICSILIFFVSERLIFNIRGLINTYNLSQEFLGIILIPILGNVGENLAAIMCAFKNKINLSLEIAIGSSIQIALFVTPVIVVFAYVTGVNMDLVFNYFQIIISLIAIGISFFVFQDGKTYWFEGAVLLSVYIMITMAYYYMV